MKKSAIDITRNVFRSRTSSRVAQCLGGAVQPGKWMAPPTWVSSVTRMHLIDQSLSKILFAIVLLFAERIYYDREQRASKYLFFLKSARKGGNIVTLRHHFLCANQPEGFIMQVGEKIDCLASLHGRRFGKQISHS